MISFISATAAFIGLLPLVIYSEHVLKESGDFTGRPDFSRGVRAQHSAIHQVLVAINQNNMDELETALYDVSTVGSPNFGKHWSFQKVGELVSNKVATNAVVNWLRENNIEVGEVTTYGEYISARAPISQWETLLHTEMYLYTSTDKKTPEYVVRGADYSIPEELNDHILAVHGITHLPPPITHHSRIYEVTEDVANRFLRKSDENVDLSVTANVTPLNLRSIYGITGTGNGLGSQAIYGTLSQSFLASDLAAFQAQYGLPNHPVDSIIGTLPPTVCSASPNDCIETSLDLQYMLAVGQTVPIQYYSEYPSLSDGFLSFARFLSASANASNVYSISYGSYEIFVSSTIIRSFNTEAMKAGLRGITIVVSSGDDGVTGFAFRPGSGNPVSRCGYYASWPASSPYVVAVGATMNGPALSNSPEIACSVLSGSLITTGGGFSNSIAASSFQTAAISQYFSLYTPTQSSYRAYVPTNRGYPDISMPGNNYRVRVAGVTYTVSGTSASSPVFAGMVALVNARRFELGITQTGLGWLNPSIYANNGQFVLNDIVSGNNFCTASASACCSIGFEATAGWDPVTGFGSVDYAKFLAFYTNASVTSSPSTRPTAKPSARPTATPSARRSSAPSASATAASLSPSAPVTTASLSPSAPVTTASLSPTASVTTATSRPSATRTGRPSANPSTVRSANPSTPRRTRPSSCPTAMSTEGPTVESTV